MICAQKKVNKILSILKKYGDNRCCKRCTILSHSFQSGLLAVGKDLDDEMILTAFLHDIGHVCSSELSFTQHKKIMSNHGSVSANKLGEFFLTELGFSRKITKTVGNIIQAKRYLCLKHPSYYKNLSCHQKEIFDNEGGTMTSSEATEFERNPYFESSLIIRRIDDQANLPDFQITENYWQFFKHILLLHLT